MMSSRIRKRGIFSRGEDGRRILRFDCRTCRRSFSTAIRSRCYRQKKRRINGEIFRLLASGVSQRRIARLLKIDRKTVARKLVFLGAQAQRERFRMLDEMRRRAESADGSREGACSELQFDELVTFERSKCLPLSVPLIVVPKSRKILGFGVARIPARGPLAEISRRKYGYRRDERREVALRLWSEVKGSVSPRVCVTTDQDPRYPGWIRKHLPQSSHVAIRSRRGCVTGQGELKKIGFDPLFDLNHTCAMLRANINRLFRRTWCTTKRRQRLAAHLEIYALFHNRVLT